MDLFTDAPREAQADIPWTLDRAIAVFLNRWCHRAMGDRVVAEQELRALIAQARSVRPLEPLA